MASIPPKGWDILKVRMQRLVRGLIVIGWAVLCTSTINSVFAATNADTNNSQSALHRLDFRLEGKSCAACLLSIQRKLNSLPGVKEAVVMLKRPYGVSVIYQASQIKSDEIVAVIKEKEPNIKVLEINDTSVSSLPLPLIPPFVPMNEPVQ